eukprot:3574208-Rhodomonas_salina.1
MWRRRSRLSALVPFLLARINPFSAHSSYKLYRHPSRAYLIPSDKPNNWRGVVWAGGGAGGGQAQGARAGLARSLALRFQSDAASVFGGTAAVFGGSAALCRGCADGREEKAALMEMLSTLQVRGEIKGVCGPPPYSLY